MNLGEGGLLGRHVQPLRDRREAVWQEMVAKIQDRLVAYTGFATPDAEAEWAQGVMQLFDLVLDLAVKDRWLTPVEAQAIRGTGAARCDQGFDVAEVRESVRIAIGVARTHIMQEYAPTSPQDNEAMDRVLALLDRYGNEVEDLLCSGHDSRRDELAARGDRAVVRFVDDLLEGQLIDEADFSRRARVLGFEPKTRLCFVLLPETSAGVDATGRLKDHLASKVVLGRASTGPPHRLVIVPASAHDCSAVTELARVAAARSDTTALVVGPCQGAAECHDRYSAAVVLVPHLRVVSEGRPVLHASDLTLFSVLASLSPSARQSFRRDILRGVDEHPKLLEFLRVSIQVGFILNAVVRETDWDIKTVRDRKRQVETATGRRYDNPIDQTLLTLGYCSTKFDT